MPMRRFRWRIIPAGAWAANALGLSTQVPARITYLSDGPNRKIEVGKQTVYFKHAQPKEMRTEGEISSLVVQALRYLGKDEMSPEIIARLRSRLSPAERPAYCATPNTPPIGSSLWRRRLPGRMSDG